MAKCHLRQWPDGDRLYDPCRNYGNLMFDKVLLQEKKRKAKLPLCDKGGEVQ